MPEPVAAWRSGVVWLLFLATLINYTDRLAINNTQAFVLNEFVPAGDFATAEDRAAAQNLLWGRVNFAFGISFALFQILAGFLADRFSLRTLYLGAILVWSGAGIATGFVPAGAVAMLMLCRVVLGVGEAFNWPCAVACVRRVIPRESRGLANGIFHSGASVGAILTPFLVLLVVGPDGEGWRTVFLLVGAVGGVWAVLWLVFTRGERGRIIDDPSAGTDAGPPVPVWPAFGTTLFFVCLATGVGVNLCWHFYNQWFPRYLSQDLHFDGRRQQWVLAGFYTAADLGSLAAGWTICKLTRGGLPVEAARKRVMLSLAAVVFLATLPAAGLPTELVPAKLVLFYVVAAAAMGGFSVFFSLAQDVSPRHTAQILGVCGCGSWLVISGVTMLVGGYAKPGLYANLFLAVGCVPAAAAVAGLFWPTPPRTREPA